MNKLASTWTEPATDQKNGANRYFPSAGSLDRGKYLAESSDTVYQRERAKRFVRILRANIFYEQSVLRSFACLYPDSARRYRYLSRVSLTWKILIRRTPDASCQRDRIATSKHNACDCTAHFSSNVKYEHAGKERRHLSMCWPRQEID